MFYNCKNIKKIDLSSFDIKNNTNLKNMFLNCDNLKEIKVSKECFDKINQANPLHKQIIKEIEIYPFLLDVSPSICKVQTHNKNGLGFLLKYQINEKYFYCFISSDDIITENMIKNEDSIIIYYNNFLNNREIKLKKERYIKNFKEIFIDVTIVEILDKDNISNVYFLLSEINNFNRKILNNQIYITSFKFDKLMKNSIGKIKEIDRYKFIHSVQKEIILSGSPISLINRMKVMGIYKKDNKDKYSNFIYPILFILKTDIQKKQLGKNEEKTEYINLNLSNDEYYIGQSKNGLRNGRGIQYNKNGDIIYEGEFINDIIEDLVECQYLPELSKNYPEGFIKEFIEKSTNIEQIVK